MDVSLIGAGGFADVYRVRQAHLGRWAALKVFRVALRGTEATTQFRAECQAVSRLDDVNVVRVYDAGLLPDGRPYLLMELCDTSLRELVVRRGGALHVPEAAELGYRVATALLAAHSAQVIHGDVNPSNILIRPSGAPVLADFGLATMRDYRGSKAGGFSPAYAAPEALRHNGIIDELTDVYGLGATLYAMVTGRAPFALRWGETEVDRNRRVLEEPVTWPPGVSISDGFHGLVSMMLAKSPPARPVLSAVADALAERRFGRVSPPQNMTPSADVRPGTSAPADDSSPRQLVAVGAAPPTGEPVDAVNGAEIGAEITVPKQPGRHRRRRMVLAMAAAAIAISGGAFIVATSGAQAADESSPALRTVAAPSIVLAPPESVGSLATRLTWSGTSGLVYTVVIRKAGAVPHQEPVGESTTVTVATEPAAAYCFQVHGANGEQVAQSNVQPLRGGC